MMLRPKEARKEKRLVSRNSEQGSPAAGRPDMLVGPVRAT
jgi:hypothetical protein